MDINNILSIKKEIIELKKEKEHLKTEFDEIISKTDDKYIKHFRKKNIILSIIFPFHNDINALSNSKKDDILIPIFFKYIFFLSLFPLSLLFGSIFFISFSLILFYIFSFITILASSSFILQYYKPNLKKKKSIHTKLIVLNKSIQKKEIVYNELINNININNFKPSFYDQMNPSFIYFLSDLQEIYKENPQIINLNNNNNSQKLKNY